MKIPYCLLLLLTYCLVCACASEKENQISVNVLIENGMIVGTKGTDSSILVFKGIPYAKPPLGEMRWKAPQEPKNWAEIRDSKTFGPNAMQAEPKTFRVWTEEFLIPQNGKISEDCLYLNVWTGVSSPEEKRPVIVYIHGGGFVNGSGSVPIYDGEAMAQKGIVFVTINYRLGVFGFLVHPELSEEAEYQSSGNYGFLDQIAALKWVRKNIASFGGDPENITIAGQSAGSASVNILAASPLAKGLFHKIIAESGALVLPGMRSSGQYLDSAEIYGKQFAEDIGAKSLQDLRQMSAEKILSAKTGRLGPIVDDYVLPEAVSDIFANNKQADVPLLTGYNGDDLVFSAAQAFGDFETFVKNEFGDDASTILKYYPPEQAQASANHLLRDLFFGLQNYAWGMIQDERGKEDVYQYFFNRKVPIYKDSTDYGAFHTGEVAYAYDNLQFLNRPLQEEDYQLAKLMSTYWANFAKTGNPNGDGLAPWPEFDAQKGEVMIFDAQSAAAKHPYHEALKYMYERALKE